MGIEPYQVTSSVLGVLNQRLVRRLCDHCKRQESPSRWVGSGCEKCFSSGFAGRALLAELVEMEGDLRKAVLAKADIEELEAILARRGHEGLASQGASWSSLE